MKEENWTRLNKRRKLNEKERLKERERRTEKGKRWETCCSSSDNISFQFYCLREWKAHQLFLVSIQSHTMCVWIHFREKFSHFELAFLFFKVIENSEQYWKVMNSIGKLWTGLESCELDWKVVSSIGNLWTVLESYELGLKVMNWIWKLWTGFESCVTTVCLSQSWSSFVHTLATISRQLLLLSSGVSCDVVFCDSCASSPHLPDHRIDKIHSCPTCNTR